MDATRSADELHAALLRRCWPPPDLHARKRLGVRPQAFLEIGSHNTVIHIPNPPAALVKFTQATHLGRHQQAERLSHRAAEMRAVPA